MNLQMSLKFHDVSCFSRNFENVYFVGYDVEKISVHVG